MSFYTTVRLYVKLVQCQSAAVLLDMSRIPEYNQGIDEVVA